MERAGRYNVFLESSLSVQQGSKGTWGILVLLRQEQMKRVIVEMIGIQLSVEGRQDIERR